LADWLQLQQKKRQIPFFKAHRLERNHAKKYQVMPKVCFITSQKIAVNSGAKKKFFGLTCLFFFHKVGAYGRLPNLDVDHRCRCAGSGGNHGESG
jgi:hypothetical protein